jgi:glyoxylase-like metal-dependent hydrolase (beta-lactamase superfamily II)/rhodanese-related sulfurtransferase
MIFQQFYLDCLSHASYLIGDEKSRTAAVVDPQRDVQQYIDEAAAHGLRISHIFLTHFHADFVAGHLELQERTGAAIYLGRNAVAEFDFVPVSDATTVSFGDVRLQILETPGHTPESISIVVFDETRSATEPYGVLTGDTLFAGDVGRPDLLASKGVSAEDLAAMLFDSLHNKLLNLPAATLVYPAHGAGSACGKSIGKEKSTTIGIQKTSNLPLQIASKADFVKLVTTDLPPAPAYFAYDADLNRRQRPTLEQSLQQGLVKLNIAQVVALSNTGAQIVDVRDPAAFAALHVVGSTNIGLNGKFAHWAGSLLDHKRSIVIIAEPGTETQAATRLGRIGFDNFVGYLEDPYAALANNPHLVNSTRQVSPNQLSESDLSKYVVLDVRAVGEWTSGHLPHSMNIPVPELPERFAEVPRDKDILVHCASGYRSSIAASLLEQHGFTRVTELAGGYAAWAANKPTPSRA